MHGQPNIKMDSCQFWFHFLSASLEVKGVHILYMELYLSIALHQVLLCAAIPYKQ
jgi:hypothetical protein